MTDSMNFGPEWLRNLSSEGTTAGGNAGGGGGGGVRYQLAEYRYGREEMLALYEKGLPAPSSLCTFAPLYSEAALTPLALQPHTEEERQWQVRGAPMGGPPLRGARGALSAERGGRMPRGRGAYQPYGRSVAGYETGGGGNGWGVNNGGGGGEQTEWSTRKEFSYTRGGSLGGVDNWRRSSRPDEDDGWRTNSHQTRSAEKISDKWSRSSSWREGDDERVGPQPDKSGRTWHDGQRGPPSQQQQRWSRDNEDHLPEWVTEHLGEGGGTFDSSGAFHGSDDEQEGKGGTRKDHHLQKSTSQQNITTGKPQQHTPLSTSKSAVSLSKPPEPPANNKDAIKEMLANHVTDAVPLPTTKTKAPVVEEKEATVRKEPEILRSAPPPVEPKSPPGHRTEPVKPANPIQADSSNRVDEDFDKLQEDLVLKLVVEEEQPAKTTTPAVPHATHSNGVVVPPPPNMMPPIQEKWYYQDPQGDLQGPFLSTEMAEWFKAGYFSARLFVRRQCDERFYTLGDLVTLCGDNPFQTTVPIAPLKQEPATAKVADEMLQYHQIMQAQMAAAAAAAALRSHTAFGQGEPWSSALSGLQQRELLSQQFLVGQQQVRLPIPAEPFMPPPTSGNQLFQMLNHLKMNNPPPPMLVDKPPVGQMDSLQALVHQMGGMQSMQPRTVPQQQPPPVTLGAAAPTIKHEPLHGLPINNGITGPSVLPGLPTTNSLIGGGGVPKPQIGKIDGDNNMNFLQFLQKPQMEQSIDLETLWRKNQYTSSQASGTAAPPQQLQQQQWQQEQKPITMWDLPAPVTPVPPEVQQQNKENSIVKEQQPPPQTQINNESAVSSSASNKDAGKEERKKREAEEKRVKKEAEEKRKAEQRRLEQEREKRRKEEERVRKELEKAKRELEEKRAKEAAEKRRLKEQRKLEAEEARKRAEEEDELRKSEEREKEKLAAREREEQQKRQLEIARQNQKLARAAPWSQSVNNQELSLAEIQKLEKERKAAEVALVQQQQQQQQRLLQQQQEQQLPEKPAGGLHLSWANRPARTNQQVKSLAEIQAEEQERLVKVKATEKAQAKEKETLSPPAARIWQGQTLTWNNNDSSSIGGFWDEPQHKPQQQHSKPVVVNKVANSEVKAVKPQQPVNSVSKQNPVKPAKAKASKKEEHPTTNNNNSSSTDDFTEWCTKTLANMNTPVDIPTFVNFLFDIESALDVREYCRDYLGDRPATQQFAAQFLEKRRLFKPKATAHKDDMCSPAPAITPSSQQHNNNSDFQEVKGKGKKCKKSKMLKVDSRILGFNVTAAQDRINVGDRDYGDTT